MKKHILHPKLSFENMRDVIEFAGNEFAGKTAYSFRQSPLDRDVIKISFHQFRNEEFPKNTLRKIMRFKIDMTID